MYSVLEIGRRWESNSEIKQIIEKNRKQCDACERFSHALIRSSFFTNLSRF